MDSGDGNFLLNKKAANIRRLFSFLKSIHSQIVTTQPGQGLGRKKGVCGVLHTPHTPFFRELSR
jgi:hypothetical protein